jgi:hypothetical protein
MGVLTRSFQPMPLLGPGSHLALEPSGRAERVAGGPGLSREQNVKGRAVGPSGLPRCASTGEKAAHPAHRLFRFPFGSSGRTGRASAGPSWLE